LMKCITQEVSIELLEEIHSGTCGNHVASRTLVGKAFWAGFYWRSWYAITTGVSFLRSAYLYQHMRSRPYQPPGPLRAGSVHWQYILRLLR
jgi:hypothetical protein